jgi:hypothetical protein
MDSLIRMHQYQILSERERELKLQILRKLRIERSYKKGSIEEHINKKEIVYLTRKLDETIHQKRTIKK